MRTEIILSIGIPLNCEPSANLGYLERPRYLSSDAGSGHELNLAVLEIALALELTPETVRARCRDFCRGLPISYAQTVPQVNRYVKQFGELPRNYEDLRIRERIETNIQRYQRDFLSGRMPHPPDTVKKDCKYYFDSSKLPAADNPYPLCSVNPEAKNCKECSDYE